MRNGIIIKKGLGEDDLKNIQGLNEACNRAEKLNMKLNWDMLSERNPEVADDYFYFIEDEAVGYLGMYGFGSEEIEITGMVHPNFRRKGIFSKLLKAAREECQGRGIGRILLICEHDVESGSSFSKAQNSRYDFSEYRMERDCSPVRLKKEHGIVLKPALEEDSEFLFATDSISFGTSIEEVKDYWGTEKVWASSHIALYKDERIGKIRAILEEGSGFIYGFVVLPEHRGRGYGREILSLAIEELLKKDPKNIMLEVACQNERALNLYKSCGFEVTTIYDYYEIKL